MQKKWIFLPRKAFDTRSLTPDDKAKARYERAKELYHINYANHTTMKKNGEYEEYCKYHISNDVEHEWSNEIKEQLTDRIRNGFDLLEVVNLSNVNLPENEIIDTSRLLSSSPLRDEILTTIELLKPLFEPGWYEKIAPLFK